MPLVQIVANRRNNFLSKNDDLLTISQLLQRLVAEHLTCDDPYGSLLPEEVDITFRYRDWELDFGIPVDLQIIVDANDLPSRRTNLEERHAKLQSSLASELQRRKIACSGSVWIRLMPASYGTFCVS